MAHVKPSSPINIARNWNVVFLSRFLFFLSFYFFSPCGISRIAFEKEKEEGKLEG